MPILWVNNEKLGLMSEMPLSIRFGSEDFIQERCGPWSGYFFHFIPSS